MKKSVLTVTALLASLTLAGCASGGSAPEPSQSPEASQEAAQPTVAPTTTSKSISINGEAEGSTHLVEYKAYSRGGTGEIADASVRWTTKKLPKFADFSKEWEQTMAFQGGERASVLVMSTQDVSVGCELYIDGLLVDSQGLDTKEYKVECVSDVI